MLIGASKKVVGYCPKCKKPFKWHLNELDISTIRGIQVIGRCKYLDQSEAGYAWGLATRKPAREYETGARMCNEVCGFINNRFPGYPCLKPRGHDEDTEEFGVHHDHGPIPITEVKPLRFPGFKKQDNGLFIEG